MKNGRPKRAFLAYCALAARLKSGAGITQAMTPFLAEVCKQFHGELFDAQKFSNAVNERFGFPVPRLAALGLAEQLAEEGLLVEVSGHVSKAVYRYATVATDGEALVPPLTETEVERVLANFVQFCRGDEKVRDLPESDLQDALLSRLLHVDSMRLLSRREGSAAAKRTRDTLVLSKRGEDEQEVDGREFHLDFLVSQFLLDLRDSDGPGFEKVSDLAFANMAAEAIACFTETATPSASLQGLTVYLDSPLILDILGVNTEYAEYGAELLDAIKAAGAKPAVFDHSVNEAENTVSAQLAYLRSGVNKWGAAAGTNPKPDLLSAITGNIAARAVDVFGIEVHRDPEIALHRRAASVVGDIQAAMNEQMIAWKKDEARDHDQKSAWQMLALRNSSEPCPRICDSQWLFLTRNTSLVNIANRAWVTWLKGATSHSTSQIERWAPVAMSDKQFAGYLWARSGGGVGASIPRARLLAHCSAAVRPRADVKARAYNLVLEYEGEQQADYFAALLEDREAAKALMRATRGDPEDVTADRLPYIMDVMKRAAGEYAATKVREEAEAAKVALLAAHERQMGEATAAAAARAANEAKAQHDIELAAKDAEKRALADTLRQREQQERQRKAGVVRNSFSVGRRVFILSRWAVVVALGAAAFTAADMAADSPLAAAVVTALVTIAGVWFVPDLLNKPLGWIAKQVMLADLKQHDPAIALEAGDIDFRSQSFASQFDGDAPSAGVSDEVVAA